MKYMKKCIQEFFNTRSEIAFDGKLSYSLNIEKNHVMKKYMMQNKNN